jgi:hypothetical protein
MSGKLSNAISNKFDSRASSLFQQPDGTKPEKHVESAQLDLSLLRYDPETGHLYWTKTRRWQRVINARPGDRAGAYNCHGIHVHIQGRRIPAHSIVWFKLYGVWPHKPVKHLNGDKCDNRPHNLALSKLGRTPKPPV